METRPTSTPIPNQNTNQPISTIYSAPTPLESVNSQPPLFTTTHHPSTATSKPPISAFIKFIRSSISKTTSRGNSITNNCANNHTTSTDGDNKNKSTQHSNTIVIPSNNGATNMDIPTGLLRSNTNNKGHCLKTTVRPGSVSSCSTSSSSEMFCRFCQEIEPRNELVTPCLCSGTLKFIHQSCLQRWIKIQDNRYCEICKFEFHMKISTKPFREWQKLDMNAMERRKIICSVTFHIIALTCVIWSLYVLIDRTTEEMHQGHLEWPFWTKLIVVAIGFVGGVVFMYVQCRMYITLCRKWHDYNRIFIVQNISESDLAAAQAKQKQKQQIQQKALVAPSPIETSLQATPTTDTGKPMTPGSEAHNSRMESGDIEANSVPRRVSSNNDNTFLQPTTSNSCLGGSAPVLLVKSNTPQPPSLSSTSSSDKQ